MVCVWCVWWMGGFIQCVGSVYVVFMCACVCDMWNVCGVYVCAMYVLCMCGVCDVCVWYV